MYRSMDRLPGLYRDQNGNLLHQVFGWDARRAYEYVRDLPLEDLQGTVLHELLDWIRWGSEYGCLWYCDTQELFGLIQRWEEANPAATKTDYIGLNGVVKVAISFDQIWPKLKLTNAKRVTVCPVHNQAVGEIYEDCPTPNCALTFWDYQERWLGPRGFGTYDVESDGVDGWQLAAAAYASRNWIRLPVDISRGTTPNEPLAQVG